MKNKKFGSLIAVLVISMTLLCSCGDKEPSLKEAQDIAELATYEAYYNKVARYDHEEAKLPLNIFDIGYKEIWFEYTGVVKFGIDVKKLEMSEPNKDGVVKVKMPAAKVLGEPDIKTETITEPIIDKGLFVKITNEDTTSALRQAQADMLEVAKNDEYFLEMTRERAKILVEQYIVNVGDALGKEYTVKWVE